MARYDIAIIGTGPAGLEAAITAKARNKSVFVLGPRSSSDKVTKAHQIRNYLGLPDVSGEDMKKAFLDHAANMGVEITEGRAGNIYAMGDYFTIQVGQDMIEAQTVILATGVVLGKPYPGEEEYLGRGVSYCATCDGNFYKGKKCAVISTSKAEEAEVDFLADIAEHVYYFPLYKEEVNVSDKIEIVKDIPKEISGKMKVDTLTVTDADGNDQKVEVDGVFILRDAVSPGQLVPGLATDGPHVVVDIKMATNIPGCFAAGDIAGTPYQYIKSAGQGNIAAISAVAYIDEKKRNAQ